MKTPPKRGPGRPRRAETATISVRVLKTAHEQFTSKVSREKRRAQLEAWIAGLKG